MITPYPYQQPAVDHHIRFLNDPGCRFHLNCSHAGRGKTVHVAAALAKTGHDVFVVCPASVTTEWRVTLEACGVRPLNILGVHSYGEITYRPSLKKKRPVLPYGRWLRKDFIWDLPKGAVVVFDEVHQCSSPDHTTRTPYILKGIGDNPDLQAVGLSATYADSPLQMKAIGYALGLHNWQNFKLWAYQFGVIEGTFGGLFFGKKFTKGDQELMVEHPDPIPYLKKMMAPVAKRITAVDFPPDFPRQQVQTLSIDVKKSSALDNIYLKTLEKIKEADRPLPITTLLRSRQESEFLKVPAFATMTLDAIREGRSVVAFFNFQASLQLYVNKLKKHDPGIYDGSSDADRQAFQRNELRILAVTMAAGGQSINLHDTDGGFPRTALISPSYSARELVQALGRTFRANQKSMSLAKIVFAAGTVESQVRAKVEAKVARIATLTDADLLTEGERGVSLVPVPDELLAQPEPPTIPQPTDMNLKSQIDTIKKREAEAQEVHNLAAQASQHSDRGHSKHSPSSLKPKAICPGYESDNSGPPHPVTLQGTRLHEVLDGSPHPTDDEEDEMLELCRGVEKMEQDEMAGIMEKSPGNTMHTLIEPEVTILKGHVYQQKGHIDRLIMAGSAATIIDWKFGYTKVDPAKTNWQGMGYAVGVFETYPDIESVKVVFVQPRRDYLTEHTFLRSRDYQGMRNSIIQVIFEAEKPDDKKTFKPDPKNCKYCARNKPGGGCPAIDRSVTKHVNNIDSSPPVSPSPGEEPRGQFEDLDFTKMGDPAMMGKILDASNLLEEWCKNAKKTVHEWVKSTDKAPVGYTPFTRKGNRTIPDVAAAVTIMPAGTDMNAVLDCCSVSVPKLEKLFCTNSPSKSAKKDFQALLEEQDNLTRGAETIVLRQG